MTERKHEKTRTNRCLRGDDPVSVERHWNGKKGRLQNMTDVKSLLRFLSRRRAGVLIAGAQLMTAALVHGQVLDFDFDARGNLLSQTEETTGLPQILSQPQPQVATPGALASFFVVAANTRGLGFQWKFNNANIDGATSDALLLQSVGGVNEGLYSVVLTNGSGSVTSSSAALMLDSDRDGLPDSWEQTYFGGLTQTATGDSDGDGVSHLDEFLDGTNPASGASALFRLTLLGDGGSVSVAPVKSAYNNGEVITLTAAPFAPNIFHGWTGAANSQNNPVTVTMNAHKTVRAVFASLPPPPGLVGWWRGQGNALDAMGANHGTAISGASYAEGKVGQGFVFDGVNDHIFIPDAPSLRPESITLEAWASFNALSGPVIARARGTGIQNTYVLYLENSVLKGFITDAAVSGVVVSSPLTPVFGQWYHVGFSFDNVTKQQSLYIDGVRVATLQSNRTIAYDNHPVLLGGDIDNGVPAFPLNGRVDEAAIYNRALTPEEMATLHASGLGGKSFSSPYFTSLVQSGDIGPSAAYSRQVTAALGTGPITFSTGAGSLPPGLTLSPAGLISGIPVLPGSYTFAIRATDSIGVFTEQLWSLRVLPPAMPAGLVAWWRAETNAQDSAGTNHGTAANGATYAEGRVGQSFRFDGVNDYVNVPDAAALRPASVTLEAWVIFNAASGPIIARTVGSAIADSYILWLNGGNLNGAVCDIAGAATILSIPFAPVFGQWYHVAFSFDDFTKQQALYLNGDRVATNQSNRSIGYDNHPVLLGGDIDNGSPVFLLNGRIDEAAIYNRALTADEVAAIWVAGAAGKASTGPYINSAPLLPVGFLGQAYSRSVATFGGTVPVDAAVVSGSLPGGLFMDASGLISGTPAVTGTFSFVVRATDGAALTAERIFTLQVVTPAPAPPGIIAWWRAETNAQDSIGSHHGTATNGATYAGGMVGQSFAFDGVNDYINIPDAPALRPASVSLEAWAMFHSPSGPIISRTVGSGVADSYILWVNEGRLNGAVCDIAGASTGLGIPFTSVPGQWYHLAFTFDNASKEQALYLDGVRVAANLSNRTIGYDNHPVLLGGDIDNGTPGFLLNGRVDEAAIYGRALRPVEVAALYNAGPAGRRPLTPYEQWNFTYLADIEAPGWGDPDSDGVVNLMEFAAGTHPGQSGAAQISGIRTEAGIEFAYTRNKAALPGMQFAVEWSDSLVARSWSTAGVTDVIISDGATLQQVTATVPMGNASRRFVRLRVTSGQ